jgi:hypothetical protein
MSNIGNAFLRRKKGKERRKGGRKKGEIKNNNLPSSFVQK